MLPKFPEHGDVGLDDETPMFYDGYAKEWLPILINSKGEAWTRRDLIPRGYICELIQEEIVVPQPNYLDQKMKG